MIELIPAIESSLTENVSACHKEIITHKMCITKILWK